MPRWLPHSRNFAGLRRRWGLNQPIAEVLTGVLPVVQVDKHRQADDQDIFGMFTQAQANAGSYAACALVAQEHEVLIHRVECKWNTVGIAFRPMHIFTPLQAYNPFDVAQFAYFSWWQGPAVANDVGKLGNTFGVGGLGSALQVVVVNGVPVVTIGPTVDDEIWLLGAGTQTRQNRVLWGNQDPPFRLKPFTMACVQCTLNTPINTMWMEVSWWYSERQPQGDVG